MNDVVNTYIRLPEELYYWADNIAHGNKSAKTQVVIACIKLGMKNKEKIVKAVLDQKAARYNKRKKQ